ncbi:MAG: pilin [Patescibacteria group bacterium]|nr:pilin [Patescibacteria group bacterium]
MKYLVAFSLILILLAPVPSLALGLGDAQEQLEEAGGAAYGEDAETEIEAVIGDIINALLSISGVVFLVLMVYGGYLWMTAHGNEDAVKKAKSVLTAAFIGIIIVVLAYGITYFVIEQLLNTTSSPEGFKPSPF